MSYEVNRKRHPANIAPMQPMNGGAQQVHFNSVQYGTGDLSSPILIAFSYHERAKVSKSQALLNNSASRRLQKQECDEEKSRPAVGSKFQAAGSETVKQRDPYHDSLHVYASVLYRQLCKGKFLGLWQL